MDAERGGADVFDFGPGGGDNSSKTADTNRDAFNEFGFPQGFDGEGEGRGFSGRHGEGDGHRSSFLASGFEGDSGHKARGSCRTTVFSRNPDENFKFSSSFGEFASRDRSRFNFSGENRRFRDGDRSGRSSDAAFSRSLKCFNCGEEGHRSNQCTAPCGSCGRSGHVKMQCSAGPPRSGGVHTGLLHCNNCGSFGHAVGECNVPGDGMRGRRPFYGAIEYAKGDHVGAQVSIVSENIGNRTSAPSESKKKPREPSTYVPRMVPSEKLIDECTIGVGQFYQDYWLSNVRCTRGGKIVALDNAKSFLEAGIDNRLLINTVKSDYKALTPIQSASLKAILAGDDVMACSQTGTGKTAAYLLPIMTNLLAKPPAEHDSVAAENPYVEAIVHYPKCLVVLPTRELALQVFNEARKFAIGTTCVPTILYGGTSVSHQRTSLSKESEILVVTVGRLIHFLNDGIVSLKNVKHLVLDEADRMLNEGFLNEVVSILEDEYIPKKADGRQTLMMSATFPVEIQQLAGKHLDENYLLISVNEIGSTNTFIDQRFVEVSSRTKLTAFLDLMNIDLQTYQADKDSEVFKKKTLVFVRTKSFADTLGAILCEGGFNALTIHGDRNQSQRESTLSAFRHGECPILIATGVAERGLDIRGVDHVVNYDLPKTREEYVHRIGRTGRIGNPGRATSLFDPAADRDVAPQLLAVLAEVHQEAPRFLLEARRGFDYEMSGW